MRTTSRCWSASSSPSTRRRARCVRSARARARTCRRSPRATTLRFPGKAVRLPVAEGAPAGTVGNLLVADAGHHSLAELAPDGETLVRRIGSGERGWADGGPDEARFAEPNGLCLVPAELRSWLDYDVLVADTVNHLLRGVRLADGTVTTVAGTGEQYMVGASDNEIPVDLAVSAPRRMKLSSPWDVVWSQDLAAFVVAMAGNHTLWAFDDKEGSLRHLAGTMNEGLVDGPAEQAWFAQTSGLAAGPDGRIWLADSEVSALRWLDARSLEPTVGTAVGQGLFDFGHRDGPADAALLQHPLGVAVLPDGSVAIADTYNGAVRRWAPSADGAGPGEVTTLARDLAEPSGLLVDVQDDGAIDLLVVESAAHRLTRLRLPARLTGEILDAGAHRTKRPVSEIGAGEVRLDVLFTPATGQKYDDRYGPSTRLQVSASPPELLLDGAGDDVPLQRVLRINPAAGEGVLHVTAQAASCDDDPAIEYPACHLNQQDWGVPVRVVEGGPAVLTLPLHG